MTRISWEERKEILIHGSRYWILVLYRILRDRPFFNCPWCEGAGGAVEGYYEREWSECWECWDHYEKLYGLDRDWFIGRVPFLVWLRIKVCGEMGWKGWFRCRVLHRHVREEGVPVCTRCWGDL